VHRSHSHSTLTCSSCLFGAGGGRGEDGGQQTTHPPTIPTYITCSCRAVIGSGGGQCTPPHSAAPVAPQLWPPPMHVDADAAHATAAEWYRPGRGVGARGGKVRVFFYV
jgi:hypothetical protein